MKFWISAIERAVKTVAQTAVATIVAANVSSVFDVDAWAVVGVSALAGLLSVLSSVASAPIGEKDTPSLVEESH